MSFYFDKETDGKVSTNEDLAFDISLSLDI